MNWVARLKEVAGQDDLRCPSGDAATGAPAVRWTATARHGREQERESGRGACKPNRETWAHWNALDDLPRNPRVPTLVLQDIAKALQDQGEVVRVEMRRAAASNCFPSERLPAMSARRCKITGRGFLSAAAFQLRLRVTIK